MSRVPAPVPLVQSVPVARSAPTIPLAGCAAPLPPPERDSLVAMTTISAQLTTSSCPASVTCNIACVPEPALHTTCASAPASNVSSADLSKQPNASLLSVPSCQVQSCAECVVRDASVCDDVSSMPGKGPHLCIPPQQCPHLHHGVGHVELGAAVIGGWVSPTGSLLLPTANACMSAPAQLAHDAVPVSEPV